MPIFMMSKDICVVSCSFLKVIFLEGSIKSNMRSYYLLSLRFDLRDNARNLNLQLRSAQENQNVQFHCYQRSYQGYNGNSKTVAKRFATVLSISRTVYNLYLKVTLAFNFPNTISSLLILLTVGTIPWSASSCVRRTIRFNTCNGIYRTLHRPRFATAGGTDFPR